MTVLVEDRFVGEFVVLHGQIVGSSTVISIMNLDVFNSRHGNYLPIL